MKVRDIVTGNILESDNELVIESWKSNSDRFVVQDKEAPEKKPTTKKS